MDHKAYWALADQVATLQQRLGESVWDRAVLRQENAGLVAALEDMALEHCSTWKADEDYNGQIKGTLVTDSGALGANAVALRTLARLGRFRIVSELGRMVVGYWPSDDPARHVPGEVVEVKA